MTVPGYPDYQRIALATGVVFAAFTGAVPGNTQVFEGYVGNWRSVRSFWESTNATSLAYYFVYYTYWTDSTFTVIAGGQTETRSTLVQAYSQHVPITPWLTVSIVLQSGVELGEINYTISGDNFSGPLARSADNSSPLLTWNDVLPAGSTVTHDVLLLVPGLVSINSQSTVAGGVAAIFYYQPANSSYIQLWCQRVDTAYDSISQIISVPDAPLQIQNSTPPGVAGTLVGSLTAVF